MICKKNKKTKKKQLSTWFIYIDNTLHGWQIKFICTSFRNRRKSQSLPKFFHMFRESTNKFHISRQCLYIVFIQQRYVCKILLNLHTKVKALNFGWISYWASTARSVVNQCLLCFVLHKMHGTRLNVSGRCIKQTLICTSVARQ